MLILAAISLAGLTSCKKDYTCDCSVLGSTIPVSIPNSTKDDAETTCDAARATYQIVDPTATCNLE